MFCVTISWFSQFEVKQNYLNLFDVTLAMATTTITLSIPIKCTLRKVLKGFLLNYA